MTPQEKAKELVYKYEYLVKTWDCYNDEPLEIQYKLPDMKQCALIAVDEMINYLINNEITGTLMSYWEKVKQEIEKL